MQGFLDHAQTQAPEHSRGSSHQGASMSGSRIGQATAEQLLTRCYLQKVVKVLQNSFRINKHVQRLPHTNQSDGPIDITLSLDRQGNVAWLALAKSSGNAELDTFVLKVFESSRGQFPPMPSGLSQDNYSATTYSNVLSILQAPNCNNAIITRQHS